MTQPTGTPNQGEPGTTGQGVPGSGASAKTGLEVADPRGVTASDSAHDPGPGDGSEYQDTTYPVSNEALGQHAYEAYSSHTEGKSLATGDDLPAWENLSGEIQQAWHAVAAALRQRLGGGPQQEGHRTS